MPEIAEVARVAHFLRLHLVSKKIVKASAQDDVNVFGKVGTTGDAVAAALKNRKVVSVGTQGKYFWFVMDKAPHLVMHLGMTGWVHIRGVRTAYTNYYKKQSPSEADLWPPKYWRFQLETQDGTQAAFTDPRRFGRVRLVDCPGPEIRQHSPLVENGPDPVVDASLFTAAYLAGRMRTRRVPVKALLLDQAVVSGVGNWVADEALFQARLHPEQLSHEFAADEIERLHAAVCHVCRVACDRLADSDLFPDDWLFNHRWGKGAAARSGDAARLPGGERLAFLTVGGRTSCYAPELQRKSGRVAGGIKEEDKEQEDTLVEKAGNGVGGKKRPSAPVKMGGGQEEADSNVHSKTKVKKRKQDSDGLGCDVSQNVIKKAASRVEAGAVESEQALRADPAISDGRRRSGRLRAKLI